MNKLNKWIAEERSRTLTKTEKDLLEDLLLWIVSKGTNVEEFATLKTVKETLGGLE